MSSLRSMLIRLAHSRPDLRPHLVPILREASGPRATTSEFVVELRSVINPDHDESNWGQVRFGPKYLPADSLAEARDIVRQFITSRGLGNGNWAGGQVFDRNGDMVAYVSYNGRVWKDKKWPSAEIHV